MENINSILHKSYPPNWRVQLRSLDNKYFDINNDNLNMVLNDINDELNEYRISHALTTTTKIWRWSITFISLIFLIQSLNNINCISFINSAECEIWLKPSTNFYLILKNLFNFLFGASFSQPVAKFLGLFALLIYILGLLQWAIIKFPKSGRNSGFSNYGRD